MARPSDDELARRELSRALDVFRGDPRVALQVPAGASPDDVRRAFRELAKRYHPARFARRDAGVVRLANEVFLAMRDAQELLIAELEGRTISESNTPLVPASRVSVTPLVSPSRVSVTPVTPPARVAVSPPPPAAPPRTSPAPASGRPPSAPARAPIVPPAPTTPAPVPPAAGRQPAAARPVLVPPAPTTPVPVPPPAAPPRPRPAAARPVLVPPAAATPAPVARPPLAPPPPSTPTTASGPAPTSMEPPPATSGAAALAAPHQPHRKRPSSTVPGKEPLLSPTDVKAASDAAQLARQRFDRALDAIRRQRWHEAREELERLATAAPADQRYRAYLHYVQGWEAFQLGKDGDARVEWQKALACDPGLGMARWALESSGLAK